MKSKCFRLCLFLFLFLLFQTGVFASGNILISVEDITPNLVNPGEDLVVKVNLINTETEIVKIDSMNLDLKGNFIFKSESEDFSDELFCSDCTKTIIYYLQANPDLETGLYTIRLEVNYDNIFTATEDILVKVRGEPNIVIEPIIDAKSVFPSNNINISFKVKNFGTNDARNIKLETQSEEVGFNNQNLIFIEKLNKKEEKVIQTDLVISQNVDNGFYLMPIKVKYEDNQNNEFEFEENLGLNILNKANIVVQNIKFPAKIKVGEEFDFNLKIENDGFGKAKNVNVELIGDFKGNKKGFFGSIEKDEDMPQIFSLIPNSVDSNSLKMILTYQDDFGSHRKEFDYGINVEFNWNRYLLFGSFSFIFLFLLVFYFFKRKKNQNSNLNYR